MPPVRSWLVVWTILLTLPAGGQAGILNLRGGLGTVVQKDRDSGSSIRYAAALMKTSYRTPGLEFALELPFRWDSNKWEFDRTVWDRRGDWLRPLNLLRYSDGSGRVRAGLEVLDDWTPGEGFLVRNLSGRGEIDYILPGVRFRWSDRFLELDAGMDRPIDPTVQAAALSWKVTKRITLILEGAVDPEAPLAFVGNSSGGRPHAEESERLTAQAAGIRLELVDGDVLDIGVGAHVGDIEGKAKGKGGELSAVVDFTHSYPNRLKLLVRSVSCEGGYIPAWFDGAYPVYRWGPEGLPLLASNPVDGSLPGRNMLTYDIRYDLGDFVTISGGLDLFDDDSMKRARFKAQLREESGRGLEVSVWSRADGPDLKLFSADSNLFSRVGALYNFLPHFLLNVSYEHSWAFREEEAGFLPLNSILVGVMYDISL